MRWRALSVILVLTGWAGNVSAEQLWGLSVSETKAKNANKVTIITLSEGSLAYNAGLRRGDTFDKVTIAGVSHTIRTKADLDKALAEARKNDSNEVTFSVYRGKQTTPTALASVIKKASGSVKPGRFYVMPPKKK